MGKILTAEQAAAVLGDHNYYDHDSWFHDKDYDMLRPHEPEEESEVALWLNVDVALLIANHLSGFYDPIEADLKQAREALVERNSRIEGLKTMLLLAINSAHDQHATEPFPVENCAMMPCVFMRKITTQIDAALKGGGK